jgi:splicing factor 3B subunit 2
VLIIIRLDSEPESESEEEEEMEEDETADATPAPDGLQTPSGLETPSGLTSVVSTVPGGIETPDFLELRKRDSGTVEATGGAPKQLYHVVPERQTTVRGLMGSERGYDLGAVGGTAAGVPVLGEERSSKVS